jgi:hypothetical protein
MRTLIIVLVAFGCLIAKDQKETNKCLPFNYQYHFCYEPWVNATQAKSIADAFDQLKFQNDVWLKTYVQNGKRVFAIEFQSDEFLKDMSELPAEFDQEMEKVLMMKYSLFLLKVPSIYLFNKLGLKLKVGDTIPGDLNSRIESDPDLKAVNKLDCDLLLNFRNSRGRIMKTYDVNKWMNKREKGDEIESEVTYPEGASPSDTNGFKE